MPSNPYPESETAGDSGGRNQVDAPEEEEIERLLSALGSPLSVEQARVALNSLSNFVFRRMVHRNESLFQSLAENLGQQIAKNIAGQRGPFHVLGHSFSNFILCDSGTLWFRRGDAFKLEFLSGLKLSFSYKDDAEHDRWDYQAEGREASLEFGYPLAARLFDLDIELGQTGAPLLRVEAELSPVIVPSREPVVKLVYNLFRLNEKHPRSAPD